MRKRRSAARPARLTRLLRDERGTLVELNLLIAFAALALLLIPAYHSVWKAFGFAALYFGGGLSALVGLGLLLGKLSDAAALEPVRRALETAPARVLAAAAVYLFGGIGFGAAASFAAIFIAPALSSSPQGQLRAMQAVTAAGVLAGFGAVYAVRLRRSAR